MSDVKLRGCPWCGGMAAWHEVKPPGWKRGVVLRAVHEGDCPGVGAQTWGNSIESAAQKWNRRKEKGSPHGD